MNFNFHKHAKISKELSDTINKKLNTHDLNVESYVHYRGMRCIRCGYNTNTIKICNSLIYDMTDPVLTCDEAVIKDILE